MNKQRLKDGNRLRSEVLTAASMKMAVFWVVAPCTRLHAATTQKTAIF
jgi:hypothetical protein